MADADLSALDSLFPNKLPEPRPSTPTQDPIPSEANLEQMVATDTGVAFRVGNRVIDLYPIRLRDWPEASKLIYILRFTSLADIAYLQSFDSLKQLFKVAARLDDVNDERLNLLNDMTDKEYKIARSVMTQQNDIDMERVMKDVSRLTGGRKNIVTPTSQ